MALTREQQYYLDTNMRNAQRKAQSVAEVANVIVAFDALTDAAAKHVGNFVIAVDSALKKMEVIGTDVTPEDFLRICDTDDCISTNVSGMPIGDDYRFLCYEHMPKVIIE